MTATPPPAVPLCGRCKSRFAFQDQGLCLVCAAAPSPPAPFVAINQGVHCCGTCGMTRVSDGKPCPHCQDDPAYNRCANCLKGKGFRSTTTAAKVTLWVCQPCYDHLIDKKRYCLGCRVFGVAEPGQLLCAVHIDPQNPKPTLPPPKPKPTPAGGAGAAGGPVCAVCQTSPPEANAKWCAACFQRRWG